MEKERAKHCWSRRVEWFGVFAGLWGFGFGIGTEGFGEMAEFRIVFYKSGYFSKLRVQCPFLFFFSFFLEAS